MVARQVEIGSNKDDICHASSQWTNLKTITSELITKEILVLVSIKMLNPDHHINFCDNANKVALNVTLAGDDDKGLNDHNIASDSTAREAQPPGSCDDVTIAAKPNTPQHAHE